jgi:DNA-binding PadR family transcriptional regulator
LIRERHKVFVTGLPRSLYHAVERLLKAGLIKPVETSREGRRPERTVYRLTDEGRDEVVAWISDLLSYPAVEQSLFTAAVSFLAGLEPATAVQALRAREAALAGQIAAIDAQLDTLREHLPRVVLLEEEYTRALRQTELAWTRSVIDDIRTGRLTWDFEQLTADHRGVSNNEGEEGET